MVWHDTSSQYIFNRISVAQVPNPKLRLPIAMPDYLKDCDTIANEQKR